MISLSLEAAVLACVLPAMQHDTVSGWQDLESCTVCEQGIAGYAPEEIALLRYRTA
jgi:hypothetical protein